MHDVSVIYFPMLERVLIFVYYTMLLCINFLFPSEDLYVNLIQIINVYNNFSTTS